MIAKGNRRPVFRQRIGEHRKNDRSESGLQRHGHQAPEAMPLSKIPWPYSVAPGWSMA
jgi:hypothetical protein